MSIVTREGRSYFYRSVRRGGRVTSEYVAAGEEAMAYAELAEALRREAGERRRRRLAVGRAQQEALDDIDAALDRMTGSALAAAHAELISRGFHQHSRGEWRKRHGRKHQAGRSGRGTGREAGDPEVAPG